MIHDEVDIRFTIFLSEQNHIKADLKMRKAKVNAKSREANEKRSERICLKKILVAEFSGCGCCLLKHSFISVRESFYRQNTRKIIWSAMNSKH